MPTLRPDLTRQPPGHLWTLLSVAKLLERYDPFHRIGLKRRDLAYYQNAKPESTHAPPTQRQAGYSRSRIAWLLREGWEDPPEVDWVWRGPTPAYLVFLDGHHRLCAATLAGDTHILISYSGPLSEIPKLS